MIKALVCLAQGFEETEAIVPIDILRRSKMDVVVAGVDSKKITSSHGVIVSCDIEISDADEVYDVIVLPGGMPGSTNLSNSFEVIRRVINTNQKGYVCALCAAPAVVLANTGILDGKKATCYPSMEKVAPSINFTHETRCVVDGNIITGQGPGVAEEFALTIVEQVLGQDAMKEIKKSFIAR
ncbi:MAG: DJ-1/PfpI family protein [Sphaerochaetaceae bacterium]|nr:DJ-1/PfpI family protein [Sphaerochaetaceae bacterium]MDC7238379.1 DJ-1/PfpI family protein [Sphaerochaetaceae bacterium]MDC7249698.1 DJ-1/PfpI family protein [Sphaerochaetaceae bacterium]